MNCIECKYLGHVGDYLVCGYLLQGGETKYIKNNKINEVCPLTYKLKVLDFIPRGTQLTCLNNHKVCKTDYISFDTQITEENYYDFEEGQRKIKNGDTLKHEYCKCSSIYLVFIDELPMTFAWHTKKEWVMLDYNKEQFHTLQKYIINL